MRADTLEAWAERWRGFTSYRLANEADTAWPDAPDSAGSKFLEHVRDGVVDAIEYQAEDNLDGFDPQSWADDGIHEIADGAPDVYTYVRWQEFVDLAAWNEDPDIEGEWPDDLTAAAGIALYQIAERFAQKMVDDLREDIDNEADDEDDDAIVDDDDDVDVDAAHVLP